MIGRRVFPKIGLGLAGSVLARATAFGKPGSYRDEDWYRRFVESPEVRKLSEDLAAWNRTHGVFEFRAEDVALSSDRVGALAIATDGDFPIGVVERILPNGNVWVLMGKNGVP